MRMPTTTERHVGQMIMMMAESDPDRRSYASGRGAVPERRPEEGQKRGHAAWCYGYVSWGPLR